jgi:hypothetical protein
MVCNVIDQDESMHGDEKRCQQKASKNPDGNPEHNCRAAVRKNEIQDVDREYDQQRKQKKTAHGLGGAENVLIGHGDGLHYWQATNGHDGNSVSRRTNTLAQTD